MCRHIATRCITTEWAIGAADDPADVVSRTPRSRNEPEIGWSTAEVLKQPHRSVLSHVCREEESGWQMLALHNFGAEGVLVPLAVPVDHRVARPPVERAARRALAEGAGEDEADIVVGVRVSRRLHPAGMDAEGGGDARRRGGEHLAEGPAERPGRHDAKADRAPPPLK